MHFVVSGTEPSSLLNKRSPLIWLGFDGIDQAAHSHPQPYCCVGLNSVGLNVEESNAHIDSEQEPVKRRKMCHRRARAADWPSTRRPNATKFASISCCIADKEVWLDMCRRWSPDIHQP